METVCGLVTAHRLTAVGSRTVPQETWNDKRERQYEHVKDSDLRAGSDAERVDRIVDRHDGKRCNVRNGVRNRDRHSAVE